MARLEKNHKLNIRINKVEHDCILRILNNLPRTGRRMTISDAVRRMLDHYVHFNMMNLEKWEEDDKVLIDHANKFFIEMDSGYMSDWLDYFKFATDKKYGPSISEEVRNRWKAVVGMIQALDKLSKQKILNNDLVNDDGGFSFVVNVIMSQCLLAYSHKEKIFAERIYAAIISLLNNIKKGNPIITAAGALKKLKNKHGVEELIGDEWVKEIKNIDCNLGKSELCYLISDICGTTLIKLEAIERGRKKEAMLHKMPEIKIAEDSFIL